jgi:hypothetical protein
MRFSDVVRDLGLNIGGFRFKMQSSVKLVVRSSWDQARGLRCSSLRIVLLCK